MKNEQVSLFDDLKRMAKRMERYARVLLPIIKTISANYSIIQKL
jgi:hypothetical protein